MNDGVGDVVSCDRMSPFRTAPFDEQLQRLEQAFASDTNTTDLLHEVAELADPAPLAAWITAAQRHQRLNRETLRVLCQLASTLPDASLHFLFAEVEAVEALTEIAQHALATWTLERINALALFLKWLSRRAPGALNDCIARSEQQIVEGAKEARDLLFVSGARLVELEQDAAWRSIVLEAKSTVIEALARAPKSISQANAETLLAHSVYADRGRFLFELLQNADDAAASSWRVRVDNGAVTVEHDGKPFSFRDLVGVLSIGQTTKTSSQIGFFGVGFKSVYEVSARPRIHSGVFDVEIAHISIPRGIAADNRAPERTKLILPLAPGIDADELHERAKRIPPETLLTLPALRELAIERHGEVTHWLEQPLDVANGIRLRSASGEQRDYLVFDGKFEFAGERAEGRSHHSPLLLAIATHDGALATVSGPTCYSFLPTTEHTGLRVMIHGRFDLTVDRERLAADSRWNIALLAHVGELFADVCLSLVARGFAILPILPAEAELAPIAKPIAESLRKRLFDQPCLPAADGTQISPSQARIVRNEWRASLTGLDLGDGARALAALNAHDESAARHLGAQDFTPDELVSLLERTLPVGTPRPRWLLAELIDSLDHKSIAPARLRTLPILEDLQGRLVRPCDALVIADAWESVYRKIERAVSEQLVTRLPFDLRESLALRRLDVAQVSEHLGDEQVRSQLLGDENAFFTAVARSGWQQPLSHARCIRNTDGIFRSAAETRILHPDLRTLSADLADDLHRIEPDLYRRHAQLFDAWLPMFSVDDLAQWMAQSPATDPLCREVLEILRTRGPSWSARTVRQLASAEIFPTRDGSRRAVFGAHAAYLAEDFELELALPSWPWLSRAALFGLPLEANRIGIARIVDALCGAADLPAIALEERQSVLEWILLQQQQLTAAESHRLARQPLFSSTTGDWSLARELRFGRESAATSAFYERYPLRPRASALSVRLADALNAIGPSDGLTLALADLTTLDAVDFSLLAALLIEAAGSTASLDSLRAIADKPFFPCTDGPARALADWNDPKPQRCLRAGAFAAILSTSRNVTLAEDAESVLLPFLHYLGYRAPSLEDVLAAATPQSFDPDHAERWIAALRSDASKLTPASRQKLSLLPLFANRIGVRAPLSERYAARTLASALGPEAMVALQRDDVLLAEADEILCDELELVAPSTSRFLRDCVLYKLTPGKALAALGAPWNQPKTWAALGSVIHQRDAELAALPLALNDRGELVRAPALLATDSAKALLARLPCAEKLAHAEWAEELSDNARAWLTGPLEVARVVEWLREACADEAPIANHKAIANAEVVYDWLVESRAALETHPTALATLARTAILPSQRGTLRAACDLVLDTKVPDVGLGWGLAADAPPELATWLQRVFPIERRQRQAIVDHVLDGIDSSIETDDEERATNLIAFLARVLSRKKVRADGESSDHTADLEARARNTGVRERLRVPSTAGWQKPRRLCLITRIELVTSFCDNVPPRPRLDGADVDEHPTRQLLLACGASDGLPDNVVLACLDAALPNDTARGRALARYVVERVHAEGTLRQKWSLDRRTWMPDIRGQLRKANELFFPSVATQDVLGSSFSRLADGETLRDIAESEAGRFGLRRLEHLDLEDLNTSDARIGEPLVRWLETGLVEKRILASDLRALRTRLLLLSDDGIWRNADKLVVFDTLDLVHEALGEFSLGTRYPKVVAALEIPKQPDVAFIFAYFNTLRTPLGSVIRPSVERCLERLAELAANDRTLRIPPSLPLVAVRGDELLLVPASLSELRMFAPSELHAVFPSALQESMCEIAPSERSDALYQLLLRSGVHDLWSDVQLVDVIHGPDATEYLDEGQTLFAQLQTLGDHVGSSLRVVRRLVGSFTPTAAGSTALLDIACDALLFEDVLWVTPAVFPSPEKVAVALERIPQNRAALFDWLARGEHLRATSAENIPRTVESPSVAKKNVSKASIPSATPPKTPNSLLQSLRAWFGNQEKASVAVVPAEPTAPSSPQQPNRAAEQLDANVSSFAPADDVRAQLGQTMTQRQRPKYGFAFTPSTLPAPWSYAPQKVCTRFHPNEQKWSEGQLPPLTNTGTVVGKLVLRGRLPMGDQLLPAPHFSRVQRLKVNGQSCNTRSVGALTQLQLDGDSEIECEFDLMAMPQLDELVVADVHDGLSATVPDSELPDEVHTFLEDLHDHESPMARAILLRTFVQTRYRYDPTYLEDAAVGRWLERTTQGRTHRHIAALHAARTSRHLGAGVCYELNSLLCELLRRAGIPSAIATGWVVSGGELCDPDHLWCVAFLRSGTNTYAIPLDAAATRDGRPLRVPRRPLGKFPRPDASRAILPRAHDDSVGAGRSASRRSPDRDVRSQAGSKPNPYRRVPLAELERVVRHLERISGQKLTAEDRTRLEQTLKNPSAAEALLRKLAQ